MDDLSLALQMWRETRDPGLARVVRALGIGERPLLSGSSAEDHVRWLAIESEGDPGDVDRLLATVVSGRLDRSTERLTRLMERGPDPRVAEAAREWLLAGHFRSSRPDAWWSMIETAVRRWLPRDTDFVRLAKQIRGHSLTFAQLASDVATWTSQAPRPVALTEDQAKLLAAWRDRLVLPLQQRGPPPPDDTTAALFGAILDDLDDDAPRAVLADYLVARGDPLGTFVRLQLDRNAQTGAIAPSRQDLPLPERALLMEHEVAWFGADFPAIVEGAPHRGFFDEARLATNLDHVGRLVEAPGLRTVRSLRIPRSRVRSARALERLLTCEALGRLQRVGDLRFGDLPALGRGAARPSLVTLTPHTDVTSMLERLRHLPFVTRLGLMPRPDQAPELAYLGVPHLVLDIGDWSAEEIERPFHRISGPRWRARLRALLDGLSVEVRQLTLLGPWRRRSALTLVRDDAAGWSIQIGALSPRATWPAVPLGLDLLLIQAFAGLPMQLDDAPVAYHYDPLECREVHRILEDLPARPVFVDVRDSGPYPAWLRPLPPLTEIRFVRGDLERGWLRCIDDRFARVGIEQPDGTRTTLWRGDDHRLRYAWSPGPVPRDLWRALTEHIGHEPTLAVPPDPSRGR